ncbi:MAG TPA: relaxase/mobilization nuclease domain-containing protein [Mucilaginibacter sp.]|jgi:hypothetical protein
MVAKIKSGKSLIGAINYNERKVSRGLAKLIAAERYPKDMDQLNFHDKLLRLTDLAAGNERTKTNTVHISLNFPNCENLPEDKLCLITQDYMQGIGFGGQPYLVYRHEDAGHPHIHIVTTNIKSDGYRISLHYLGQNESEKARKAIELKYGLVKAEDQCKPRVNLKAEISAVEYGKDETKRVITNTLGYVLRTYRFTSLPELNAVLGPFNIIADRGSKDSRMFAHEGLVYWITDTIGQKAGVPIKASSIYGKPTLKTLEEKYRLNEQLRKPHKEELAATIAKLLVKPLTKEAFIYHLKQQQIDVVMRRNDEGRLYGITFIDQKNKTVFNGSDLGKAYSANQMADFFLPSRSKEQFTGQRPETHGNFHEAPERDNELLDILLAGDQEDMAAYNKIKKKRKGLTI